MWYKIVQQYSDIQFCDLMTKALYTIILRLKEKRKKGI